ncbi:ABC transporter substrate-binding protein [Acinetobacter qingfengensis]|uniref:Toluene tolerance protein n=1 Tax=Acinetobacter qingfengensis TaxID=1262585 RepID=A0A1E7R197_9GAMM|nr:ABC transporter substrate-binding protein [Acinetobacter qingfengensis]KAA8733290.1 ABC transporter substrate-binding protein [Acinetobacter qingfengensis]OEY93079.1 toluene tolerance protein [Acinetobacter qingfengensis]
MAVSNKVLLATSVASLLASSLTFAAPSETPPAFVKRISDQLITQLKQNKAQLNNAAVINRIVAQNIEPHVDVQSFTRLVMGQYYSNQYTTPAQRGQFTQNFRDSIIRTYAKGLGKYSNEGYTLRPYKNTNSATPVVMIDFKSANGSKIPVAFQLNAVNDQWKIRNINVSGIDLAATFRDQFKATVQQNGGNVNKAIASFKPNADAVEKKIN